MSFPQDESPIVSSPGDLRPHLCLWKAKTRSWLLCLRAGFLGSWSVEGQALPLCPAVLCMWGSMVEVFRSDSTTDPLTLRSLQEVTCGARELSCVFPQITSFDKSGPHGGQPTKKRRISVSRWGKNLPRSLFMSDRNGLLTSWGTLDGLQYNSRGEDSGRLNSCRHQILHTGISSPQCTDASESHQPAHNTHHESWGCSPANLCPNKPWALQDVRKQPKHSQLQTNTNTPGTQLSVEKWGDPLLPPPLPSLPSLPSLLSGPVTPIPVQPPSEEKC